MTEQLRYNKGKLELSYIFTFLNALKMFTNVCMKGAEKYEKYNYMQRAKLMQSVDCMQRHLAAMVSGEDIDPESGNPHVGHIVWNALQLAESWHESQHGRPELDDRPFKILEQQKQGEELQKALAKVQSMVKDRAEVFNK